MYIPAKIAVAPRAKEHGHNMGGGRRIAIDFSPKFSTLFLKGIFFLLKALESDCSSSCIAILHKKSILIRNKNYGNSNISPCKNIIFKKNL